MIYELRKIQSVKVNGLWIWKDVKEAVMAWRNWGEQPQL